jgi:hypothetical protein
MTRENPEGALKVQSADLDDYNITILFIYFCYSTNYTPPLCLIIHTSGVKANVFSIDTDGSQV